MKAKISAKTVGKMEIGDQIADTEILGILRTTLGEYGTDHL